ncbi:hypothetical protein yrohd0001_29500 [Yersinia rohdei ATCC 43380]|nr:hypothetical protein yrohd0001_29500 [Yersinia rohdei ATCC 43380]
MLLNCYSRHVGIETRIRIKYLTAYGNSLSFTAKLFGIYWLFIRTEFI